MNFLASYINTSKSVQEFPVFQTSVAMHLVCNVLYFYGSITHFAEILWPLQLRHPSLLSGWSPQGVQYSKRRLENYQHCRSQSPWPSIAPQMYKASPLQPQEWPLSMWHPPTSYQPQLQVTIHTVYHTLFTLCINSWVINLSVLFFVYFDRCNN